MIHFNLDEKNYIYLYNVYRAVVFWLCTKLLVGETGPARLQSNNITEGYSDSGFMAYVVKNKIETVFIKFRTACKMLQSQFLKEAPNANFSAVVELNIKAKTEFGTTVHGFLHIQILHVFIH